MFELFLGYPSYPIQKWYIWASFQTSRKRFRKLQEAICSVVPPHFDLFCQVNCSYKLSSGYPKDPTQKWYICASFQTSRKRFCKFQEAIWLTVINEIFKVPPHFDLFCQGNCLYKLSSGYPKDPTGKWYICASFQTSRQRFRKLQEAIWLTEINENFKFLQKNPHHAYSPQNTFINKQNYAPM